MISEKQYMMIKGKGKLWTLSRGFYWLLCWQRGCLAPAAEIGEGGSSSSALVR